MRDPPNAAGHRRRCLDCTSGRGRGKAAIRAGRPTRRGRLPVLRFRSAVRPPVRTQGRRTIFCSNQVRRTKQATRVVKLTGHRLGPFGSARGASVTGPARPKFCPPVMAAIGQNPPPAAPEPGRKWFVAMMIRSPAREASGGFCPLRSCFWTKLRRHDETLLRPSVCRGEAARHLPGQTHFQPGHPHALRNPLS